MCFVKKNSSLPRGYFFTQYMFYKTHFFYFFITHTCNQCLNERSSRFQKLTLIVIAFQIFMILWLGVDVIMLKNLETLKILSYEKLWHIFFVAFHQTYWISNDFDQFVWWLFASSTLVQCKTCLRTLIGNFFRQLFYFIYIYYRKICCYFYSWNSKSTPQSLVKMSILDNIFHLIKLFPMFWLNILYNIYLDQDKKR